MLEYHCLSSNVVIIYFSDHADLTRVMTLSNELVVSGIMCEHELMYNIINNNKIAVSLRSVLSILCHSSIIPSFV